MFGATAVRRKREKERRERAARLSANTIYPYIHPYGNYSFYDFVTLHFLVDFKDQDLINISFHISNIKDSSC